MIKSEVQRRVGSVSIGYHAKHPGSVPKTHQCHCPELARLELSQQIQQGLQVPGQLSEERGTSEASRPPGSGLTGRVPGGGLRDGGGVRDLQSQLEPMLNLSSQGLSFSRVFWER
jgi:hypothetical protein